MNIFEISLEEQIKFYNNPEFTDCPHSVNGFKGTWNFSDHNLIPDIFRMFLLRSFRSNRLSRISLDKINTLMNNTWEGPGSLEKILRKEFELRSTVDIKLEVTTKLKSDDEDDNSPELALNSWNDDDDDE
tara:strand:+ start:891 stop:1280 length:390 start_codon:yes stop_codon:yes gene_type:complete